MYSGLASVLSIRCHTPYIRGRSPGCPLQVSLEPGPNKRFQIGLLLAPAASSLERKKRPNVFRNSRLIILGLQAEIYRGVRLGGGGGLGGAHPQFLEIHIAGICRHNTTTSTSLHRNKYAISSSAGLHWSRRGLLSSRAATTPREWWGPPGAHSRRGWGALVQPARSRDTWSRCGWVAHSPQTPARPLGMAVLRTQHALDCVSLLGR